jgi:quinol monooxygenase YgiN
MKSSIKILAMSAALCLLALAVYAEGTLKLTDAQWAELRAGKIIKTVRKEEGTQSYAWSVKRMNHSADLMWKVICDLESYDEYMDRCTVSRNLDQKTRDAIVKQNMTDPEAIQKLFAAMQPGYKRVNSDGTCTVYSYQRNKFPWPLVDRWVLLEITHDDKAMKQSWRRLAGNIQQDYGSWKVYPDKDGALCENDFHIDLDIPATGPFVSFGTEVTLPKTYDAFDKMADDFGKKK